MERKDSGTRELTLSLNCPHCNEGRIKYIHMQRYLPSWYHPYREHSTGNVIPACTMCNGDYKLEELELEDK